MKVYLINANYVGRGATYLERVPKEVFSTRKQAVERVKQLIEEDKRQINRGGKDYKFFEKDDYDGSERDGFVRYWLKWGQYSHCWEIHEVELQ